MQQNHISSRPVCPTLVLSSSKASPAWHAAFWMRADDQLYDLWHQQTRIILVLDGKTLFPVLQDILS